MRTGGQEARRERAGCFHSDYLAGSARSSLACRPIQTTPEPGVSVGLLSGVGRPEFNVARGPSGSDLMGASSRISKRCVARA
jgi:hypothetical protein